MRKSEMNNIVDRLKLEQAQLEFVSQRDSALRERQYREAKKRHAEHLEALVNSWYQKMSEAGYPGLQLIRLCLIEDTEVKKLFGTRIEYKRKTEDVAGWVIAEDEKSASPNSVGYGSETLSKICLLADGRLVKTEYTSKYYGGDHTYYPEGSIDYEFGTWPQLENEIPRNLQTIAERVNVR